jgi:hypothetical protein
MRDHNKRTREFDEQISALGFKHDAAEWYLPQLFEFVASLVRERDAARADVAALREAFLWLRLFAEAHHANQPTHVLLHALQVDIPIAIDKAINGTAGQPLLAELNQLREQAKSRRCNGCGCDYLTHVNLTVAQFEKILGDDAHAAPVEMVAAGIVERFEKMREALGEVDANILSTNRGVEIHELVVNHETTRIVRTTSNKPFDSAISIWKAKRDAALAEGGGHV